MREPTPEERAALQDPDCWDREHAQRGTPNPRAGISYRVRFDGADVHAIADAARAQGVSDVEFIRRAVLAAARKVQQAAR
ncbi:MAG TPA: hypothetical protein VII06_08785 [Chloroflexota bacterium]|jgi:hypothetical protein